MASQAEVVGMVFARNVSVVISVIAKTDIAELLKDGPLQVNDIAANARVNPDALARMLRLLATKNIFKEIEPGLFANTPLSDCFRSSHPQSCRDLIMYMNAAPLLRAYIDAEYSLRNGTQSFGVANECDNIFQYVGSEVGKELNVLFNRAMTSHSTLVCDEIAKAYDFSDVNTVLDVGGGHGHLVRTILAHNDKIERGTVFDLPHVIKEITDVKDERFSAVSGDMFVTIPMKVDVVLLKHMLHDWPDGKCIEILQNSVSALNVNGRLLMMEYLLSTEGGADDTTTRCLDIEMLVITSGGRERTKEEFSILFEKSGLKLAGLFKTASGVWIIEGRVA